MLELPKKYKHQEAEQKWAEHWDRQGVYSWDSTADRENTFSVDTPPPTVSGSLHVGHVFSYTQTDILARYQRMQGKSVFYPMGWDDNGLPTERRVQNVFGISCDPSQAYEAGWQPKKADPKSKEQVPVSRQNFIQACNLLTQEDEAAFEHVWRHLGLSVDWTLQYATINDHCRKLSQLSFLDLVDKGYVYNTESPTMWDTDFQTAVAQAELEDRNKGGAYHTLRFGVEGGGHFDIATTRPELLPACIAVVAHPDDSRYQSLFGKTAITPLFKEPVPIMAADHADPEKGSGILMVCTFGDMMDVEWWKTSGLPLRQVINEAGKMIPVDFAQAPFQSLNKDRATRYYESLIGLRIKQARRKIVELLQEEGSGFDESGVALQGEPEAIEHPVKFYEKGDTPIEFITARQWFIKILEHKDALLAQGEKIEWHPNFMKTRYSNWVEGLNQDWCISRQRYFGVPFPVWYPIDEHGSTLYDQPIYASQEQLPIDPMSDTPAGFSEDQRDQPNGFKADPDVMDTWATSSLTPQLMSHWGLDDDRHKKVFPMDIRPQSHEIIRTWAFYTIAKAWMHEGQIPWRHVTVSGWVLDPDRKKMSKSKGNVVTPDDLLTEYSSDAIRYWAARARLGADTAFDETVFTVGKKLSTKLFNASKFVLNQMFGLDEANGQFSLSEITEPVDQSYIEKCRQLLEQADKAFVKFDYAGALEAIESEFWYFCDHYIELVKIRSYREEDLSKRRSALACLDAVLAMFLRLFAPFMPYVTEEIWSWHYAESDTTSIHSQSWPSTEEFSAVPQLSDDTIHAAIDVLTKVRAVKSENNKSLKFPVERLVITCPEARQEPLRLSLPDLLSAGNVQHHDIQDVAADSGIGVEVVLGREPAAG